MPGQRLSGGWEHMMSILILVSVALASAMTARSGERHRMGPLGKPLTSMDKI